MTNKCIIPVHVKRFSKNQVVFMYKVYRNEDAGTHHLKLFVKGIDEADNKLTLVEDCIFVKGLTKYFDVRQRTLEPFNSRITETNQPYEVNRIDMEIDYIINATVSTVTSCGN